AVPAQVERPEARARLVDGADAAEPAVRGARTGGRIDLEPAVFVAARAAVGAHDLAVLESAEGKPVARRELTSGTATRRARLGDRPELPWPGPRDPGVIAARPAHVRELGPVAAVPGEQAHFREGAVAGDHQERAVVGARPELQA